MGSSVLLTRRQRNAVYQKSVSIQVVASGACIAALTVGAEERCLFRVYHQMTFHVRQST